MKFGEDKISRRKLLGTAAGATAALPLLHESLPHQGVHDQFARAAGEEHGGGGAASAAHKGAGHRGTVGRVDPRVNGFDPQPLRREVGALEARAPSPR